MNHNSVQAVARIKRKRPRTGKKRSEKKQKTSANTPSLDSDSDQHTLDSEEITPTTSSDNGNPDWPPSLSTYVTNCFARSNILSETDKVIFNRQLQKLIEIAVDDNLIWKNDWSNQKLPILDGVDIPLELENTRRERQKEAERMKKEHNSNKPHKEHTHKVVIKSEPQDQIVLSRPSSNISTLGDFDSNERKRQRSERFTNTNTTLSSTPLSRSSSVIGKCTDLEKSYLRLTSEPDASRVRPQQILQKSLKLICEKYSQTKNYSYVLDQFRSIRQDLMVQNIKNNFTIVVYETNAKISLENDDLGQFNQCQSQLKYLYYLTRKNNPAFVKRFFRLEVEFLMYQIVYMMITFNTSEIFRIKLEILQNFKDLHTTSREITLFKFIQALFKCETYMITGNYLLFFNCLKTFKQEHDLELALKVLGKHLYGKFRIKSLVIIIQSYRQYPIDLLTNNLGFEKENECMKFLESLGLKQFVQLINNSQQIECFKCKHLIGEIMKKSNINKVDIKGQI